MNESSLDVVMRRVRKLLKLARSDNPNEAAAAMAEAQRLLLKHGLEQSVAEMEAPEAISDGGAVHLAGVIEKWRMRLAHVVARSNQCCVLVVPGCRRTRRATSLSFFGYASDLTKAGYLYGYYSDETNRLAAAHGNGRGRSWKNSFRHGVIDALVLALAKVIHEARAEAASTALVRLDTRIDAVADAVKGYAKRTKSYDSLSLKGTDAMARIAGRRAGETLTKSDARAAIEKASS